MVDVQVCQSPETLTTGVALDFIIKGTTAIAIYTSSIYTSILATYDMYAYTEILHTTYIIYAMLIHMRWDSVRQ